MSIRSVILAAAISVLWSGPILAFDSRPSIATNAAGADYVVFARWDTDFRAWAEPERQLLLTCSLADWLAIEPAAGNRLLKRFEAMQSGHVTCSRANIAALRAIVTARTMQVGFCDRASAELKRRGLILTGGLPLRLAPSRQWSSSP